jgi:anti-repressor protein
MIDANGGYMENQLAIFKYQENEVRVIKDKNGDPWWVVTDVCQILGLANPTMAIQGLEEDERSKFDLGRGVIANIISESGLYELIMRSDKPAAKKFREWLRKDVIPAIRKTGSYSIQNQLPQNYLEALKELVVYVEKSNILEGQLAIAAPKIEFFDAVADSKDAIEMGQVAKVLNCGIGRNKLFDVLRQKQILMNDNVPYQQYVDRGYFRVVEQKYNTPDGTVHVTTKTLVYQKGLQFILRCLQPALAEAI